MPERETKEITTPAGHKIVVKTYLTGREVNGALRDLFSNQKLSSADAASGDVKLPLSAGVDRNERLVAAALISIDGVTENPLDIILDLPASEYAFVLTAVKALADGNF